MQSKKKVLIITDFFYPHWTGISKSIYNLVFLLQNKIDFTVLTVKYKNDLKVEEKIGRFSVMRTSPLFSLSRGYISIQLLIRLLQLINRYDVVFVNSPSAHIFPVTIIAKLFGKKVVVFHQGDLILTKGTLNRIIEKIFDGATYASFLLADKVSTYTQDYANYSRVLKPFLYKFTPLLMPIYLPSKKSDQSKKRQKEILEKITSLKKQNKIIFGFGGRFVEEKGFDVLFKAIPTIIKQLPQAHFVFAGELHIKYENTYKNTSHLIDHVQEYVTVLGLLEEDTLQVFYRNIDFVVMPSRSDCFPLFQAEAMLAGAPSIVSNIPGARVLVSQSGFGTIFISEDINDLSKKIVNIASQKEELQKNYSLLTNILNIKKNEKTIRTYIEQ